MTNDRTVKKAGTGKPKRWILILAGVLAVAALVTAGWFILRGRTKFDYGKKDLSRYVSLAQSDYLGLDVTVSSEYRVSESDVDDLIGVLRLDLRTVKTTGEVTHHAEWGDSAKIYYYFSVTENGIELPAEGMTNMTGTSPRTLVLGSGSFPKVFESGIEGNAALECNFAPSSQTTETVAAGDVVFVKVDYSLTEKGIVKNGTYSVMRVETDGENPFGDGFSDALIGLHPGDRFALDGAVPFDGDGDGVPGELTLSGNVLSVSRGEKLVKVEGRFPETYTNTAVAGKDGTLYCSIVSVDDYDVPELTAEIIADNYPAFAATGDDVLAEFRAYLTVLMVEELAAQKKAAVEEKIWEKLDRLDCVTKYPSSAIRQEYENQLADLKRTYDYYADLFVEEYGVNPYSDEFEFGYDFYELDGTEYDDVKEYLKEEVAYDVVRQKMIVFRIADLEGWNPTAEEYEAGLAKQVAYYAQQDGISEDAALEKYGKTFLREAVVYDKVMGNLVDSANVTFGD